MTEAAIDRRRLCAATLKLLDETFGKDSARDWLWIHTPFPAALPSDKAIAEALEWVSCGKEEGLKMMHEARARVHQQLDEAMRAAREMGLR